MPMLFTWRFASRERRWTSSSRPARATLASPIGYATPIHRGAPRQRAGDASLPTLALRSMAPCTKQRAGAPSSMVPRRQPGMSTMRTTRTKHRTDRRTPTRAAARSIHAVMLSMASVRGSCRCHSLSSVCDSLATCCHSLKRRRATTSATGELSAAVVFQYTRHTDPGCAFGGSNPGS
jgi:hypothetical protein